ncbi:MAG TPA: dihydrofolate reductase, partial [Polyangiaceae bacterium]|nr:dihydrofolate reductase [Polyangiaceae bacterium]
IAAVARNGVIGRDNDLPWRIKDDMRFFMQKTLGHHVIMGRKNYDAMKRPLPRRPNVIISRNAGFVAECPVVTSLDAALELARDAGETEAFVIGGAQIYAEALPIADVFYRTRVLADVPGDVVFPAFDESEWDIRVESEHASDERNEHPFVIETLTRRRPSSASSPG